MNTHYFTEEHSEIVYSCSLDSCEICGIDTKVVDSLEEILEEQAKQLNLVQITKKIPEGVETTFGYLCPSCLSSM